MRKQQEYSATVVRNRNELIDATTAKTKVILIEGGVLDTLHKEIKKEKRTNGGASAFSKLSAVGAVTYLIPGLNMVSIPTAAFLGIASFVFGALGADTEHLKKYDMFHRLNSSGKVISLGLIWRGVYEPEDDLIVSPYEIALFTKNQCPKCRQKLSSKHIYGNCPNCGVMLSRIKRFK